MGKCFYCLRTAQKLKVKEPAMLGEVAIDSAWLIRQGISHGGIIAIENKATAHI